MDFVNFPEKAMPLRNINAQEKSGEGNEIMKRCLPLALGDIFTEQKNITGLCIGKDFAGSYRNRRPENRRPELKIWQQAWTLTFAFF